GFLGDQSLSTLAGVIAILFVGKSVFSAAVMFWQASFLARDEGERTIVLFWKILHASYSETAAGNTAAFIRDLHVSMPLLYRGAANSLSQLMADLLGLIALLIIVIVRAPAVGLSLTVFLV